MKELEVLRKGNLIVKREKVSRSRRREREWSVFDSAWLWVRWWRKRNRDGSELKGFTE